MISPVDSSVTGGSRVAAHDAVAEILRRLALIALLDPEAGGGLAVVLRDDDVLGDVDQAASQVARVRRAKGGVGETLARPVRRDEVLEDRQTLAERGANGQLDDTTIRVGHQAAHCPPSGGSG